MRSPNGVKYLAERAVSYLNEEEEHDECGEKADYYQH